MIEPDITVTFNKRRPTTTRSSESLTDGEDSTGTGDHISSLSGDGSPEDFSDKDITEDLTEDYDDDHWEKVPADPLQPPRTYRRAAPEDPRSDGLPRHQSRRETLHTQIPYRPSRVHRQHYPPSSESVDSAGEELAYDLPQALRQQRQQYRFALTSGGQSQQYGSSYAPPQGYSSYQSSNMLPPGQQLVPFANQTSPYAYPSYSQVPAGATPGYYGPGHPTSQPLMGAPMPPHANAPYGNTEMIHHSGLPGQGLPSQGYYPYPAPGYPHPMAPSPVYAYPTTVYTPPPPAPAPAATPAPAAAPAPAPAPAPTPTPAAAPTPPPAPPPAAEAPKVDDGYARLEKLLKDERADREAREAAAIKAEKDRVAKALADKQRADEITAAASAAAAKATSAAEKAFAEKFAAKAAEDAAKAQAEAAKAQADAEATAAAAKAAKPAAPPPPPPKEKKKPIKFKDAVGRKFSFPFHLCSTWEGMEDLIRQAFLHVDIIGPHVAEGHYDLLGPNGDIILPRVWETVVEPDWTITMHMWPMPEPPKPEEPVALPMVDIIEVIPPPPGPPAAEEPKKAGKRKPKYSFFAPRPKPKPKKA